MRPNDPFEKHPAVPLALENRADTLVRLAEEAGDHEAVTDRAFQPAVASWDGVAAPELQAADVELRSEAEEIASQLAWAAVPLLTWAEHVRTFNSKVDSLLDRYAQVPAEVERKLQELYGDSLADQPDPLLEMIRDSERGKLVRELEKEWHDSFNLHVDEGEREVVAMLKDGPTWGNLELARELGVLPTGPMAAFFTAQWEKTAASQEAERIATLVTGNPNTVVTVDELEQLAEILDRYAEDDEFSYLLLSALGQEGLLELTAAVAVTGGEQSDERLQEAIGAVQTGLATALATATTRRGTGGNSEFDPYQPAEFELGPDWILGLTAAGREQLEIDRLHRPWEVYGYQALGVLLNHGDYDDRFLALVGAGMIDFEIEQGGSDFWLAAQPDVDGVRLNWIGGSGADNPAGFDPLIGLMNALAESPEATRDLLTSRMPYEQVPVDPDDPDGPSVEVRRLPRLDYLLTDREWLLDLVLDPATAHLPLPYETSPGIAAFGRALEGAALVNPDERSHWIVESIIYETATDEQALGLPNGEPDHHWADTFRNVDLIHPELRQSLANITDHYIQDLHWAMVGFQDGPSADVPYEQQLDIGRLDPRHLQMFLADLGKDSGARDTIAAAQYVYAAELYDHYLVDWDVSTSPPEGLHAGVTEPVTRVIAALDVGDVSRSWGDFNEEDMEQNQALRTRFFWVELVASAGTDLIPGGRTIGHGVGTSLDQLEQDLQQDSTGRANYYHGGMKDVSRQILSDQINRAAYEHITSQLSPDDFLLRVHDDDVDLAKVLVYPEDHSHAGGFVPMEEWEKEHHAAWEKFFTAPDNSGVHQLRTDAERAYNLNFLTAHDDLESDR